MNIIDLIILSGLENSKSEVRRLINGNAIKIDNEIVKDQNFQINQGLLKNNFIKLSIGKKRHLKIEIN
jgi:tyrosyl-tRNA synthetase